MSISRHNSTLELDWTQVDAAVEKFAPKFWGQDTGSSLMPLPQTRDYKLDYLRKTLAVAPSLLPFMIQWIDNKRLKTSVGIEKLLGSEIVLPDNTRAYFADAPRTTRQAYRYEPITTALHATMADQHSPVEYVRNSYQRYFDSLNQFMLPEQSIRVGHVALELFVFAAGGDEFSSQLQQTTADYYEQLSQRHEQKLITDRAASPDTI